MTFSTISALFLVIALLQGQCHIVIGSHRHREQKEKLEICAEPTDLEAQWSSLHSGQMMGQMHETFYMMSFLGQVAANHSARYTFRRESSRTVVFNGSTECLKDVAGRDPCPVYHVLNTDPNRYPHVLLEARCSKCIHCRGLIAKQDAARKHRHESSCEADYYYVRVLRRLAQCVDHVYQYAQDWEPVQVGCSCRRVPRR